MTVEKEYFDAKFEGLEKLMASQEKNLTSYVGAVSTNVKEVAKELREHKESVDAHGIGASNRNGGTIIAWVSLLIAAGTLLVVAVPLIRHMGG